MKNFKTIVLTVSAVAVMMTAQPALAKTYTIDQPHSTLGFAVKHLVVSTTRGQFTDYAGSFTFDSDDLSTFNALVTIEVESIDTSNEGRDKHLRSGDFFDVENHPQIIFKGKSIAPKGDIYEITGDLTIRGVTKEIKLPVVVNGPIENPMSGGSVIGLEGQIVINRQDYGVSWSKALDNGGKVVADEVTLVIEIEGHAE